MRWRRYAFNAVKYIFLQVPWWQLLTANVGCRKLAWFVTLVKTIPPWRCSSTSSCSVHTPALRAPAFPCHWRVIALTSSVWMFDFLYTFSSWLCCFGSMYQAHHSNTSSPLCVACVYQRLTISACYSFHLACHLSHNRLIDSWEP